MSKRSLYCLVVSNGSPVRKGGSGDARDSGQRSIYIHPGNGSDLVLLPRLAKQSSPEPCMASACKISWSAIAVLPPGRFRHIGLAALAEFEGAASGISNSSSRFGFLLASVFLCHLVVAQCQSLGRSTGKDAEDRRDTVLSECPNGGRVPRSDGDCLSARAPRAVKNCNLRISSRDLPSHFVLLL